LAAPAHGADWFTWDDDNTALHVPLTALMVVDLGQTLWIADNCRPTGKRQWVYDDKQVFGQWEYQMHESCYERYNTYLGEHPSRGEVWTYFAGSYALTTFATWVLPEKYSHALQGGVIGLELYMVGNNIMLGIGSDF
jgi:hypothetical protein